MDDDAQRNMEQKALKNVRGLVDNLQASDQAEKKTQKAIIVAFVVIVGVIAAMWWGGVFKSRGEAREVVVPPLKMPDKK